MFLGSWPPSYMEIKNKHKVTKGHTHNVLGIGKSCFQGTQLSPRLFYPYVCVQCALRANTRFTSKCSQLHQLKNFTTKSHPMPGCKTSCLWTWDNESTKQTFTHTFSRASDIEQWTEETVAVLGSLDGLLLCIIAFCTGFKDYWGHFPGWRDLSWWKVTQMNSQNEAAPAAG